MAIVDQYIENYLSAVEHGYGSSARRNTVIEYRGGNGILLQRPNEDHPTLVNSQRLNRMTDYIEHFQVNN